MSPLATLILEHIQLPEYRPLKPIALAKELHVPKAEWPTFREVLDNLIADQWVRLGKDGLVSPPANEHLIAGMIKKTAGGYGFLMPAGSSRREDDLYIAAEDMSNAQSGDEVLVALLKRRRSSGQRCGRIVEITQRATHTFVGSYFERHGRGYVQIDGSDFPDAITVGDPGAKGAQPDDKVVIEMVRFPAVGRPGEAVLIEVLGPRGKPGVDTLMIIHQFGLPDAFSEEVLAEAHRQADLFSEEQLEGRVDLTGETIITIDPVDARDFDDAISLTREENGHWQLGVHIADVAHFVQAGSLLDKEAQKRGTSVYLPDRVLPMLPEVLSNSLASLQQGKVRFTKSVQIEFDAEGVPLHASFANSAIKVTQRFAYEQVLPTLKGESAGAVPVTPEVRELLSRMLELAMLLRGRRFKSGALELTMPEVKIDFSKEGQVSGAHVSAHDASHQIIEEFMLAANVAVATALADRGIPFMRRVHGDPDENKLRAFGEFVQSLGFSLKKFQSRRDLQRVLDEAKESPTMHAVNYALLRSMKQAEYSAAELGHYALAEENYCHFTSPIRRYPDLMVHRLIGALAAGRSRSRGGRQKRRERTGDEGDAGTLELLTLARHCSRTERRAAEAERELVKLKLLTYMSQRIGEELDAVITGVQEFGFFCQGVEIPAEGLVHISALTDDYYDYEDTSHRLIGRRTGRRFRLGDRLRVVISQVDMERRLLSFQPATGERPVTGSSPKESGQASPKGSPRSAPAKRSGFPRDGFRSPPGTKQKKRPGRKGRR